MIRLQADRFGDISPLVARLLLAIVVILMVYGVVVRERTQLLEGTVRDPADTDVAMYGKIVERIHAGEGYYQAAGSELRSRGYASGSIFNWRMPTLASFMALLPSTTAARMVIGVFACTALVLWTRLLENIRPRWLQGVGGILLFFPFVLTALPPFHLYPEAWCGVFIALSVALYAQDYRRTSVAFGLAALFVRELALPFVVVMLIVAWWDKRRGEAAAWLAGLAAFAVFLGVHAWLVSRQLVATDRMHEGWRQLGGWPFVLKTVRAYPLLQLRQTPSWIAAVLAPPALLGLAAWSGPTGTRVSLTVGAYILCFLFVGRSVNAYWGLVYAPLLPLGLLFAPQALVSLVQMAGRPGVPDTRPD